MATRAQVSRALDVVSGTRDQEARAGPNEVGGVRDQMDELGCDDQLSLETNPECRLPNYDVQSKVCCLGCTYIGIVPMCILALQCPHLRITLSDVDQDLVERWVDGKLQFDEPGFDEIFREVFRDNLSFTENVEEAIQDADYIFVAVETPVTKIEKKEKVDLSRWERSWRLLFRQNLKDKVLVDKSDVPYDAIDLLNQMMREARMNLDTPIVFCPEFFPKGSAINLLLHPHIILIGCSDLNARGITFLIYIYGHWYPTPPVQQFNDLRSFFLVKLTVNLLLASRINIANMLANLCADLNADVTKVLEIASLDPRIGTGYLDVGIGYGGQGLIEAVKKLALLSNESALIEQGSYLRKMELLNEDSVNHFVTFVTSKLIALGGKVIAIFGVSYKPETDDLTNSPCIEICKVLLKNKAELKIHDPVVDSVAINAKFSARANIEVHKTIEDAARNANAIYLFSSWIGYLDASYEDLRALMLPAPHIFLGRNVNLNRHDLAEMGFCVHSWGSPSHTPKFRKRSPVSE